MTLDDALVKGVTRIANYRMHQKHPILSENHFNEVDVAWILESLALLLKEWDKKKPDKIW